MPSLTEYLERIGLEVQDRGYTDATGTIRSITKDEMLARGLWRRALGYEKEVKNTDGTMTHRVYPPDPKAQQFIFERREGKIIIAPEQDNQAKLLQDMSDVAKNSSNDIAQKVVDDSDSDTN